MLARWAGCAVVPRLTKKTDALIVSDADQVTTNLQRAKEYGIEIVPEPEFIVGVGVAAEAIERVTGRWTRRAPR
jgi:NAD-dependent DNA ligase